MTGAIDAHVHVWPVGAPGNQPARFTPEEFLAESRLCGVGRAVLVQFSACGLDHAYLLEAIRRHPGVFSGVGTVDAGTSHPEAAMMELARQGIRGFRIVSSASPETWPDTPGIAAVWRRAAEHRLAMRLLIDSAALPALGRMCARFPDTPVVIDHLARIGFDGRIDDADVRALCRLAMYPNVGVKVSAFYALGRKQPPYTDLAPFIRRVFEHYGPRRLMWGSDAPFQMQGGHTYAASIALIREHLAFLSDADRACLLATTAERLFFTR